MEAIKSEMKNKWSIRLTTNFGIEEFFRCLRNPIVRFRPHTFCWGRVLFWYIDFKENKW